MKTAALTNHRQQAAAGTEILFVRLQMLGQTDNPFGQNGNLYRGRA
jgi:hypothetical protein